MTNPHNRKTSKPAPDEVKVEVKYNGCLHHRLALKGLMRGDLLELHLLPGQLPKGYQAEHESAQMTLLIEPHLLFFDAEGNLGCKGLVDLDQRAASPTSNRDIAP